MSQPLRRVPTPSGAALDPLLWESEGDAELAARVRSGDMGAFETLFHAHYDRLCAFVLGYVDSRETAEDLVQELFARLWERRAEWEVRGSVRGYLYAAARNRALSHLRHARVVARWTESTVRDIGLKGPSASSADDEVRSKELAAAIARAVGRLPPRRRQAYTLRWQHDLSLAEIAAVMGVTVKCVELHLAGASKAVREVVAEFV